MLVMICHWWMLRQQQPSIRQSELAISKRPRTMKSSLDFLLMIPSKTHHFNSKIWRKSKMISARRRHSSKITIIMSQNSRIMKSWNWRSLKTESLLSTWLLRPKSISSSQCHQNIEEVYPQLGWIRPTKGCTAKVAQAKHNVIKTKV